MKNLITITLLFIAQLSFGQVRLFTTEESSFISMTATERSIQYYGSDTSSIKIDSLGMVSIVNGSQFIQFYDSTSTMYNTMIKVIRDMNKINQENSAKVYFYESRFGRINGSLDSECVELLPAIKPAQPCVKPKKKYNNKRT